VRLLRVGPPGRERPAALDDSGVLRDLSVLTPDVDGALLSDPVRMAGLRQVLLRGLPALPVDVRIGPPVARPGKVVGIGLNYRCHAAEAGLALPERPVVFLKAPSTVVGPHDAVVVPAGCDETDHEVELAVVLGRTLRGCTDERQALDGVGGYLAANDVTERALAADGPTWAKGKCHDTFLPLGPWLVTPDELPDPHAASLRLWVNDELRQSSCTSQMAVGVGALLCYLSGLMTLEPGDVVLTGTPGGVAAGRPEPRPFLRHGDVVELEVAGLGRQRTPVLDRAAADS
jgi:2-keto-4-pentenoate hydratase/2-oxohepta-3-ene-1,7-dioic acid hydratase in catechol pathway